MALDNTQKSQIMRYLGWPDSVLVEGSQFYNNWMNERLDMISEAGEPQVEKLVARILGIDDQLEQSNQRLKVGSIDGLRLQKEEQRMLHKERKNIIRQLSDFVNIPLYKEAQYGMF